MIKDNKLLIEYNSSRILVMLYTILYRSIKHYDNNDNRNKNLDKNETYVYIFFELCVHTPV